MKEEKIKGKNNKALIVTIIILSIAIILLGGYIFLHQDNLSTQYITGNNATDVKSKNEQKNEKKASVGQEANMVILFDGSKAINNNEKNYTLSCQGNAGIWITVDSTQKSLTFSFTPTRVVEFYPVTWTSTKNEMANSTIVFDKKVVDIFFGSMGQSSSGDTLFILLEDGTVEYIPIVHMFNHTQAEVTSYGRIDGINDVAKFILSSTSGGVTTLAVKSDGTFYDLWYALKDTGNY